MKIFERSTIAVLAAVLCTGIYQKSNGQHQVTIDVANVLNDISNKPVGININHLMDGSYLNPSTSTVDALKNMGVKFLRFPGGEKADNYLWSVSPWSSSDPHFARSGTCAWPANDNRFAENDNYTVKDIALDFDEFMSMCQAVGAEPLIVVAYDGMYRSSSCGGSVPTKSELLKNAEEWVRYANITKGYNIKYWMIGNESYMSCDYNGCATPQQYRDDVIEFSQRMKAVDPSIKIIANGEGNTWWSKVLPTAAEHIDFLGLSNYPVWDYSGGYTYYKNNTPDFVEKVNSAINAINSYAPASERDRIKIITTEFNSMDWAGGWPDANDLGHALLSFEILGQHLEHPDVETAFFWNTRWVNNTTNPDDIYDALDSDGNFNANGRALATFANHLLKTMVGANGTTAIRPFASYDPGTEKLNVWLVNKETTAQSVTLNLSNYTGGNATAERWELTGSGPGDVTPQWGLAGTESYVGNPLMLNLKPVSITLLTFEVSISPLPIELIAFNAYPNGEGVLVEWSTATEYNNDYFTVERSEDGKSFTAIGTVKGAGTSLEVIHYTFLDSVPVSGTSYYRLKQTDYDGSFTHSDIVTVSVLAVDYGPKVKFSIFPNPSNGSTRISFPVDTVNPVELTAFTTTGKVHFKRSFSADNGEATIDVSSWPKGIYIIQVIDQTERSIGKLVVE